MLPDAQGMETPVLMSREGTGWIMSPRKHLATPIKRLYLRQKRFGSSGLKKPGGIDSMDSDQFFAWNKHTGGDGEDM
ncbi:hypothetical protein HPP92_028904, partial [Vanilla planifolia]